MPFGLSTCPSTFQRFINTIFRDLVVQGIVLPYMDDIVILAKNESEAIDRLKKVLQVSSHIIENNKLFPSPSKTKSVVNYPEPKTTKEVQRFLGLTGYFRKFIPAYSVIAKPLSDLLRKDTPFNFDVKEKASFDELKRLLCQKPVLGIYRQNCETEIHTDASIDGLAAVLLQRFPDDNSLHPIYYMSRKTSETERKYTSYELEVLAIIEALKKFKVYILGMPFKIITDCNAFTKTMSKKDLNTRIARWALNLQDYDYTILHRSGSQMAHVDALSRIQVLTNQCNDSIVHRIKESQELDPHILSIKALLQKGPYDNYCIKNNILYKFIDGAEVLVIPDEMQHHFIKNAHDKGHFSVKRTLEHIKNKYFIPQLQSKIEKYISNCVTCILKNKKSGKQEGLLHPLVKDDIPLNTYHIDHLGPLATSSKNYKFILAVIDSFTKFVWLYPTKTTSTSENKNDNLRNPIKMSAEKAISALKLFAFPAKILILEYVLPYILEECIQKNIPAKYCQSIRKTGYAMCGVALK
ncbi:transposon Tf2-6 polyprotein [Trichonephila clavipes]|nr:transposon Tf2-6 polyprotein [Trichonephila clavipes]